MSVVYPIVTNCLTISMILTALLLLLEFLGPNMWIFHIMFVPSVLIDS